MRNSSPFNRQSEPESNRPVDKGKPLEVATGASADSSGIDLRQHSLRRLISQTPRADLVNRQSNNIEHSDNILSRWQVVRLKVGIVMGMGTSTFVAASTIIASGAYLVPNHPIEGAVIAFLGGRSFFTTLKKALKAQGAFSTPEKKLDSEPALSKASEQEKVEEKRVQQSVSRVSPRVGGTMPTMEVTTVPSFYFIEEIWGKNVLGFSPAISSKLSDRELDALVAHELSHQNQLISKLDLLTEPAVKSARLITFCSTAYLAFSAISVTSPVGGVIAVGAGLGAGLVAAGAMTLLAILPEQIARRSNELLTDYRAIRATQDPESYRSALQKAHTFALGEGKELSRWNPLQLLYQHPSLKDRVEFLDKLSPELDHQPQARMRQF